ncbi:MAG: ATP-binding protein, partial [Chloroflexi bacterium]|nr:ATP-binding protein [Chloroflexota bacterium]
TPVVPSRPGQATVDNMLDLVTVCDATGRVTYINPAYTALVGRLVEPGLPLEEHPKYYQIFRSDGTLFAVEDLPLQRATLRDEEVRAVEIVHRATDGREITCVFNAAPLHDESGRVIGAVAVGHDITQQRRAEADRERLLRQVEQLAETAQRRATELDVANKELDAANKELDAANKELDAANKELDAANKELQAFSYSVSHDLRAPLRHIDGFGRILLRDYSDKLDEQGKHYLQVLREGSQRMEQLIDAMLKLSRVTRAEMRRRPVDMSELAASILAELHKEQPERQVELTVAPNVIANGDPALLRIVLENLLGNAWKFTSKRPVTKIEFGVTPEDDKPVYHVKDNGAGFDMAYVERLFSAFQRLHKAEEFPGTGIGLATVQRIIHRHGGRVGAEGGVDGGATFFFTLDSK